MTFPGGQQIAGIESRFSNKFQDCVISQLYRSPDSVIVVTQMCSKICHDQMPGKEIILILDWNYLFY